MNPYMAKNQNNKKKGGSTSVGVEASKPTMKTTRKTSYKKSGINLEKAYDEEKERRRKFTWGS